MPALRWPDSGVRQDLLQQEHERTRVRISGPLTSGSLHLCESSGGLMPLMPCPDLVTCQDAGRLSQGSELTRKRDALDYGSFKRRQNNADFSPPDAEAAPALFLRERVSPKCNQLIDSRQPRGRSGPAQKQIETATLFEPGQTLIPRFQIGRAPVCTPVTNPPLDSRLLLEKKKPITN